MNFVALKVSAGDRPTFYRSLIALCLALFAGVPLYGQSGSTAASQGAAPYGGATQLPRARRKSFGRSCSILTGNHSLR